MPGWHHMMSPVLAAALSVSLGTVLTLLLWYGCYHATALVRYLRRVRVVVKHVAGVLYHGWWYALQAIGYHVFHRVRTTSGYWMRYDRVFSNRNQELVFKDNRWLTSLPPEVVCDRLIITKCPRLTRLPLWLHSDGHVVLAYCQGISVMPKYILATRVDLSGSWGVHTIAHGVGGNFDVVDPEGRYYSNYDREMTVLRAVKCTTMRQLSVMALSPMSSWLESAVAKGRLDELSYNDY